MFFFLKIHMHTGGLNTCCHDLAKNTKFCRFRLLRFILFQVLLNTIKQLENLTFYGPVKSLKKYIGKRNLLFAVPHKCFHMDVCKYMSLYNV